MREKEGKQAALNLLSGVLGWGIAVIAAISILSAASGWFLIPLLGSNFDPGKLELTRSLFHLLLPILIFSCISSIGASVLNADDRFALAAGVPFITPVVTIVSLLLLGGKFGIYVLVVSVLAGFACEAALLVWGLYRRGLSVMPRLGRIDGPLLQVAKQCVPMLAGAFLLGSTSLVDQAMAAMLGPGSVSVLNYGNKLVGFFLGIASVAIGTAVFPHFSRMVAAEKWAEIRHDLTLYARTVLLVSIPFIAALFYFSEPLVRLIFERGAFTAADTVQVARVQAMYVLQIGFYLAGILLVRFISSMKGNAVLMCSAMISLPLNIMLNLLFMERMGVSGIALSTSLVYAFSLGFLSLASYRMLRRTRT